MAYEVELLPTARKELARLPRQVQVRVIGGLDQLAVDPYGRNTCKIHGPRGDRRLRVGSYRVLYAVDGNRLLVTVIRIRHRRDVYRFCRR